MSLLVDIISQKLKETEFSRCIRLICCGNNFDFDSLKLTQMFPNNILKSLATNPNTEKTADGGTILRINSDLQSLRLIYLYYNTMDLIIPESSIERELLLVTCDYFGFTEISQQIESALMVEKGELAELPVVLGVEDEDDNENSTEAEIIDVNDDIDENYIHIKRPKKVTEKFVVISEKKYTINPDCTLSVLDKNILLDENILRKEYAIGNKPKIPRVDFLTVSKDRIERDHAYTYVHSRHSYNYKWVNTNEEFIENLKMFSFGVLDENMPDGLVVAGSAAFKCAIKIETGIIPDAIMNKLLWFRMANAEDIKGIPSDYQIFSQFQNIMNPADAISPETKHFLEKMILCHPRLFLQMINTTIRSRRYGAPDQSTDIYTYFTKLSSENKIISNDIDLFLTTENPDAISAAIKYVHDRMCAIYGETRIIRTENSVTFYPNIDKSGLPIQIILRAYDSVEHVILGFDIDSCCIGFDGQIICSDRWLRSVRYGYNLIDLTRLSETYEPRIMKYLFRGFDIAMTRSNIETVIENMVEVIKRHGGIYYTMLRGIYKLGYLLISYHRLAKVNRIHKISDYSYSSVVNSMKILASGIDKIKFVYGTDLDAVLFDNKSNVVNTAGMSWSTRRMYHRINNIIANKQCDLPPLRIIRHNVTKQTDSDELFTGSFNPIQMAWYDGAIII